MILGLDNEDNAFNSQIFVVITFIIIINSAVPTRFDTLLKKAVMDMRSSDYSRSGLNEVKQEENDRGFSNSLIDSLLCI